MSEEHCKHEILLIACVDCSPRPSVVLARRAEAAEADRREQRRKRFEARVARQYGREPD